MKNSIKRILQKILGFNNYLFIFSLFTIIKLKWDKNEKDFIHFMKLIKGEGIILDIGANIGIMSTHLSRKFKNDEIIAFEPMPENIRTLERIKKILKQIEFWRNESKLRNYR